jgi:hypothetical protein
VRAILISDEGLGLDVAADRRTEEAFLRVLPILAEVDARTLRGRRLDADDFDNLRSVSIRTAYPLLKWRACSFARTCASTGCGIVSPKRLSFILA